MKMDDGLNIFNVYESSLNDIDSNSNLSSTSTNEQRHIIESLFFKTISLEQIQACLKKHEIDDEHLGRSAALFDIQKYTSKLDRNTYHKMINAILEEESASWASLRHATFPSLKLLDENPKLFQVALQTTLDMKDTARALIFSFDLKKDFLDYSALNSNSDLLDNQFNFPQTTFLGFLFKKLEQMQEDNKEGFSAYKKNRLDDYTCLLKKYNYYDELKYTPDLDDLS